MSILFLGGPVVGWLLNGDRGLLFGLVVSVFAIVWFVIEERKLL
jgi:hypothetical protein